MPQGLDEGLTLFDSPVKLLAMIEVIGKGGMDIRQGQIMFGGDFIRVHAQPLVPEHDVLNRDAAPGDMRLPPRHSRRNLYMPVYCFHSQGCSPFLRERFIKLKPQSIQTL